MVELCETQEAQKQQHDCRQGADPTSRFDVRLNRLLKKEMLSAIAENQSLAAQSSMAPAAKIAAQSVEIVFPARTRRVKASTIKAISTIGHGVCETSSSSTASCRGRARLGRDASMSALPLASRWSASSPRTRTIETRCSSVSSTCDSSANYCTCSPFLASIDLCRSVHRRASCPSSCRVWPTGNCRTQPLTQTVPDTLWHRSSTIQSRVTIIV